MLSRLSRSPTAWMGWRYLKLRRGQYASFISLVSVVGLSLGVAVLVVVISVMNGFDHELKERILGSVPQLIIYPEHNVSASDTTPTQYLARLQDYANQLNQEDVTAAFPFFQAQGMVSRGGAVNAVEIYGVPRNATPLLGGIAKHMVSGDLQDLAPGSDGIVMGAPLASYFGLGLGDSVAVVMSSPTATGVQPKIQSFVLAGTFEVGAELDYSVIFLNLADVFARSLSDTGRSGVRLILSDPFRVSEISARLDLPSGWWSQDWSTSYGELFRAVRMEKAMMFLLLLLIVAVAAFNIVSGQTMLVSEKRSDIAILRTMGASSAFILRVFLTQGLTVAVLGILAGVVFGVLLALNISEIVAGVEQLIGMHILQGTYFDRVPSLIVLNDLIAIILLAFSLCLLSAISPARRAAAVDPVEALRDA